MEWSNKRFGTSLTPDDYNEHWSEMWKIDNEELEKRAHEFRNSDHVSAYSVIPGAKQALEILKTKFTLILITSRVATMKNLTKEWIEKNYPNIFSDYVFCGFYDSSMSDGLKLTKAEFAKDVKASYLIDDQFKHVEACSSLGIKSLLFGNYSWNKDVKLNDNITRVNDWGEVLRYFNL